MTWRETEEPNAIELVIPPRRRDLGGFTVGRLLPVRHKRTIGPFIYWDHMGPVHFEPGDGIDVPPHPHINLATVTYLFEGEIIHRDSLGSLQAILPGEINWMSAGRGIVHSERTSAERRASGSDLHGLQLWVALPESHEEMEPEFHHHTRDELPLIEDRGLRMRLLIGSAFGRTSPVPCYSPMFYADAEAEPRARVVIPAEHQERALYLVEGALACGQERFDAPVMLVLAPGREVALSAERASRVMLFGGAPVGPRHIWWNFVSSSKERIEAAKLAWKEQRMTKIPGDELEFF